MEEIDEIEIPNKTPSQWFADLYRDEGDIGLLRILASDQVQMIPKRKNCTSCGATMQLNAERMWKCNHSKRCRKSISALHGTIFSHCGMGLLKALMIISHVAVNCNFVQMDHLIGVSRQSASRFARKIRNALFCSWNFDLIMNKIGGVGFEIELDETALGEVKYHVGRPLALGTRWVFGGEFL